MCRGVAEVLGSSATSSPCSSSRASAGTKTVGLRSWRTLREAFEPETGERAPLDVSASPGLRACSHASSTRGQRSSGPGSAGHGPRAPDRGGLAAGPLSNRSLHRGSDPACHAARGLTAATRDVRRTGPRLHLLQLRYARAVQCRDRGERCPGAVLIRALEPVEGLAGMHRRRGIAATAAPSRTPTSAGARELTRRWDRLARNRIDLTNSAGSRRPRRAVSWIEDRARLPHGCLEFQNRNPGGTEHEWRCYVAGSPCVSAPGAPPVDPSAPLVVVRARACSGGSYRRLRSAEVSTRMRNSILLLSDDAERDRVADRVSATPRSN